MPIIIKSRRENLEKYAAFLIGDAVTALLGIQSDVVFAVTGGRSVPGILKQLLALPLPWDKIHFFMTDERMVPVDDEQSNFRIVKENLLGPLLNKHALQETNVHPFIAEYSKSDYGVSRYEEDLKRHGGKCDILLVSAGEDGHIASLFPNHASISDNAEYFIAMPDAPRPPEKRVSMSRALLSRADFAFLLFFGREKESAYDAFIKESDNVVSCPARLISGIKNAYVLTDIPDKNKKARPCHRYIFRK